MAEVSPVPNGGEACGIALTASAQRSPVEELAYEASLIEKRTKQLAYPEVPSVFELRLIDIPPPKEKFFIGGITWHHPAMRILYSSALPDDFKAIIDSVPTNGSALEVPSEELALMQANAESEPAVRKSWFQDWITKTFRANPELQPVPEFVPPSHSIATSIDANWKDAWTYADDWSRFLRTVVDPHPSSTIIDLPYPFLIPAGRFQEWYYWDNWPAVLALVKTGRVTIPLMQVENLLEAIRHFGFVPNGGRTYYLTRSQPPVIYRMVRLVIEELLKTAGPQERAHIQKWIKFRALPLLSGSYFDRWRNEALHHDKETGLAHWWSEVDLERPEKSGNDDDRKHARSFRAVRAECESGRDFSAAFEGCADEVASVMLNSLLFEAETNMAWMAQLIGDSSQERLFQDFAHSRKMNINRWLWNEKTARFENLKLDRENNAKSRRWLPYATAEAFFAYSTGVADSKDMKKVRALEDLYSELLTPGGICASDRFQSHHQWDGENVWAIDNLEAAMAMRRYGYLKESREIASRFNAMVRDEHKRTGYFYERYNGQTRRRPEANGKQYPVQEGFLWTNGTFIFFGIEFLNWN